MTMTAFKLTPLLCATVIVFANCGKKVEDQPANATPSQPPPMVAMQTGGGTPVNLAGVTFRPPDGWIELGPSGQRAANYLVLPIAGSSETDSVVITASYFGPNGAGPVEDNIMRWVGFMQFEDQNEAEQTKRENFMIDSMQVHTIVMRGTYQLAVGGPMSTNKIPKPNYTFAGAILEAPEGPIYFRMYGPRQSADAQISSFMELVRQARKSTT